MVLLKFAFGAPAELSKICDLGPRVRTKFFATSACATQWSKMCDIGPRRVHLPHNIPLSLLFSPSPSSSPSLPL